ncbi:MAG TPA: beta-galactosidase, partial [Armatimonadetes bacterium]|nr:beta-galactosidase [Armatimonadota bacterium]
EAVACREQDWEAINLPHSFSLPYFAASDKFYTGYGWYRKRFMVPRAWAGKRIHLEFDGVFQVAEVFLNCRRIGEHRGGYTGFAFDVTDAAKPGDNVLALRVNNLWDARLAPRAGEHVFSGGIYRNVRLVITAPLHVAWYGTFVTTPQVSRESAKVNVKTEVANDSARPRSATVRTLVLDAKGRTVASMASTGTVEAHSTLIFDQASPPIAHPKLWSPEHPNLYSVKTIVLDGRKPVDDYLSPLGFRWFRFTADRGFFLNGEHRYFRGAGLHQDHAGWGDAVADSGFFRDVKMMKDCGFDFIRASTYPHAPAFDRACDELGMLLWIDCTFWGIGGFRGDGDWFASAYPTNQTDEAAFEANVKEQLRETIRIHRNHPSVIVWSMCNEPFFSAEEVMPKVRRLLTDMVACSHELDPTRPAAIAGCQRGDIDRIGDIAGYNGDGARLFVDPGIPNVVTEYGSTIADRPGKYEPGWGDLPLTPGANPNVVGSWRFPWRSGEAIWCGFDHGSIAGREFGAMGLVDYFRLPKRSWYWYRNEYLRIPPPEWPTTGVPAALRLTADKTTLRSVDGTDDAHIIVTVVDENGRPVNSCPPVTLTVDRGPGEFPTGPSITFAAGSDIPIRDGQAAIEFRSYFAGRTLIRATSPGLKSAAIEITSLGEPKFVPGKTPPARPRPYTRFTGDASVTAWLALGTNNPTAASSEAPGHSGRLANDGNPNSFWQAAAADNAPWLRVDLEKLVTVRQVRLTFPVAANWRYRVEVSVDGRSDWKLVAERSDGSRREATYQDDAAEGAYGRFLRVTILRAPAERTAGIAEVVALGAPAK